MKRPTWTALAIASLLTHGAAQARPDPQQPMVAPVLEQADTGYGFQTRTLESVDGQRHYRLYIGRPEHSAPDAGYPVVYLLDGNAAVGALDRPLLRELNASAAPPVIVAIGSTSPLRIDRVARTYDYTPKVGKRPQVDPANGLPSGGADEFLDLLAQQIKPMVQQTVPVDLKQQTLWGHSYGGLLVLHALMTRPGEFSTYAAASPSLWWTEGAGLKGLSGLAAKLGSGSANLLLMHGDSEGRGPGAQTGAGAPNPGAAVRQLLDGVYAVPGLHTRYRIFPGLGHGPMLGASLRYTLGQP